MSILNQNPLPFFINGQYVSPTGRQTFENINPVNGTLNFDVLESNADDVDHAVNSARSALAGPWLASMLINVLAYSTRLPT